MSAGGALTAFLLYVAGVLVLAVVSNRLLRRRSFLGEYFLGSRSLGMWAFALTFAATSASGGSFTGFPSKIYSHGWVLALWIGSYMVVPICMMGLIGKRLNQVARKSGAITVPDVFRDRFDSAAFGLLATGLIVFFMAFNLVAQFKAGSLILKTLLDGVGAFHGLAADLGGWLGPGGVDPEYPPLPARLRSGGGPLHHLRRLPRRRLDRRHAGGGHGGRRRHPPAADPAPGGRPRTGNGRAGADDAAAAGTGGPGAGLQGRGGGPGAGGEAGPGSTGTPTPAASSASPGPPACRRGERRLRVEVVELTTAPQIRQVAEDPATAWLPESLRLRQPQTRPYAYGDGAPGTYVSGPGPSPGDPEGFLPLSLAVSFFIMWAIAGTGQPGNYVRLMAFRDARTLRHSIATVTIYYSLIYFPLVIIFCCARVLLPGMEAESDRIMPAMVIFVTENAGLAWLGGLLVAAPFAAVMSTVDSFLLMISSALVRDVYQRNLRPGAAEGRIRVLSYAVTCLVGAGAVAGAVDPPRFLQDIIVYTGSGLAACFLGPTVFALYWPRVNTFGAMTGMIAGFAAHLAMYAAGAFVNGSFFRPVRPLELDPILAGLLVSFAATWIAARLTAPPPAELVRRYFHRQERVLARG